MVPPSKSLPENTEITSSGKRDRCNTGDSSLSDGGSLFDFLQRSEEFLFGDGAMIPLRSAEFVEELILREATTTGAASGNAGNAAQPSPNDKKTQPRKLATKLERNVTGDDIAPLNMEFRITSGNWIGDYKAEESAHLLETTMHPSLFTGDQSKKGAQVENTSNSPPQVSLIDEYRMPLKAAPMLTLNPRISSSDWVTDCQDDSVPSGPIHSGLFTEFMDDASADATTAQPNTQSPTRTGWDGEHHFMPSLPNTMKLFRADAGRGRVPAEAEPPAVVVADVLRAVLVAHALFAGALAPAVSPAAVQLEMPQSRMVTPKNNRKKKQRARQLNETIVVEPADNDVLCGRGGFTNNHPGNVRFREKALEFRPWYEQSSKEEKQRIADLLVESVKSQGHRFLGRGGGGLWHEVVRGAHRKASQALRERIKRGPTVHA